MADSLYVDRREDDPCTEVSGPSDLFLFANRVCPHGFITSPSPVGGSVWSSHSANQETTVFLIVLPLNPHLACTVVPAMSRTWLTLSIVRSNRLSLVFTVHIYASRSRSFPCSSASSVLGVARSDAPCTRSLRQGLSASPITLYLTYQRGCRRVRRVKGHGFARLHASRLAGRWYGQGDTLMAFVQDGIKTI